MPPVVNGDGTMKRFRAAMAALRKREFIARTNAGGCCRGCVGADLLSVKQQTKFDEGAPVIWTYKGQGGETMLHLKDGGVYMYHDQLEQDDFDQVEYVFAEYGFDVAWDGNEMSALFVRDMEAIRG